MMQMGISMMNVLMNMFGFQGELINFEKNIPIMNKLFRITSLVLVISLLAHPSWSQKEGHRAGTRHEERYLSR